MLYTPFWIVFVTCLGYNCNCLLSFVVFQYICGIILDFDYYWIKLSRPQDELLVSPFCMLIGYQLNRSDPGVSDPGGIFCSFPLPSAHESFFEAWWLQILRIWDFLGPGVPKLVVFAGEPICCFILVSLCEGYRRLKFQDGSKPWYLLCLLYGNSKTFFFVVQLALAATPCLSCHVLVKVSCHPNKIIGIMKHMHMKTYYCT